jgi:hypothetical protein
MADHQLPGAEPRDVTTRFGYTPADWERLVDVGRDFLRDRAQNGRLTTYTEFCQVVRQRTELEIDTGEYALGPLLGDISLASIEAHGVLLSALVTSLHSNSPGEGFFRLAQEQGLLRNGELSRKEKDDFWVTQVSAVNDAYGS